MKPKHTPPLKRRPRTAITPTQIETLFLVLFILGSILVLSLVATATGQFLGYLR